MLYVLIEQRRIHMRFIEFIIWFWNFNLLCFLSSISKLFVLFLFFTFNLNEFWKLVDPFTQTYISKKNAKNLSVECFQTNLLITASEGGSWMSDSFFFFLSLSFKPPRKQTISAKYMYLLFLFPSLHCTFKFSFSFVFQIFLFSVQQKIIYQKYFQIILDYCEKRLDETDRTKTDNAKYVCTK